MIATEVATTESLPTCPTCGQQRLPEDTVIKVGPLELWPGGMVRVNDSAFFRLSPTEERLLKMLLRNAPRTVTRGWLSTQLLHEAEALDENVLRVHMSRLRLKVGGEYIQTVRGMGYRWVA